ncbi:AAA family ATPase [Paenibacillus sp. GCM10012306]|uniref:AAA family ATPase n=1 Tax=Paenibacillus sp. GCM10012306 TaxID=3317342 RepID=UPI00360B18E9
MLEIPGFRTLDLIVKHDGLEVYRLLRHEDGLRLIAKTPSETDPSPATDQAFQEEFELLQRLKGTGTLEPFGLEYYAERPVLLLLDREGETLEQLIYSRKQQPTLEQSLRVAAALADCLMLLHRQNVTLNALKPWNILLDLNTYEAKIIDLRPSLLSLAGEFPPADVQRKDMLAYMSPEWTGRSGSQPDYRSDFYSLGVVLYEWLSGTPLFRQKELTDIIYHHIADKPEALYLRFPLIPRILSDIISKCMEKMPDARYASAYGIKADLLSCLEQLQKTGQIQPFPLAGQDISEHWLDADGFFGRQRERQYLHEAQARAQAGSAEMVWIRGAEGIGKTRLVQEFVFSEAPTQGYIVQVGVPSLTVPSPYGVWKQVMDELVGLLLMETELQIEVWKLHLDQALEGYGHLLTSLTPRLELLIGRQPQVEPLSPLEAQRRFHTLLCRFIQLFAKMGRPLILFIDSLEHADEASLQFLIYLMEDRATRHMLTVLGQRADAPNVLSKPDKWLRDSGLSIEEIELNALRLEDIIEMLKEAVHGETSGMTELAELLLHKTGGNPFFIQQFLQDLLNGGQVFFAEQYHLWRWDLQQIAQMEIPEHVAGYLSGKLTQLPQDTVNVLGWASILGSSFELSELGEMIEMPLQSLKSALEHGVAGHVLERISADHSLYRFPHERIREAAYRLVREEERQDIHYTRGLQLSKRLQEEASDITVFEVLHHMNLAMLRVEDKQQRLWLASLNLEACLQAKKATAYESALAYSRFAAVLLKEASWSENYELLFRVHMQQAELEYLNSFFEEADRLFEWLVKEVRVSEDQAQVYILKIKMEAGRDHHEQVITLAEHTLKLLGVPYRLEPRLPDLMFRSLRLARRLRKLSLSTFAELPLMSDPTRKAAIAVLAHSATACFSINRKSWLLNTIAIIELTLEYGLTPEAPAGFMGYALFQHYFYHNHRETYKWGKLACDLALPYPDVYAKTMMAFVLCFESWQRYEPSLIEIFHQNVRTVGLKTGDLWHANQNVLIHSALLLTRGYPLKEIYHLFLATSGDFLRQNSELHYKQAVLFNTLLIRLTGHRSHEDSYATPGEDLRAYGQSVPGDSMQIVLQLAAMCDYLPAYLFGQYREASESLKFIASATPEIAASAYHTYWFESLVWAQLYEEASPQEQGVYRAGLRKRRRIMKRLSVQNPEIYLHKYLLISAEMERLFGKDRRAEKYYEGAIKQAREQGYAHDQGIASECYAKYGLRRGREYLAKLYMTEAYEAYKQWGATAKLEDLTHRYPDLLYGLEAASVHGEDNLAIAMSSQALSGEMEMSRLLDKLMRIMLLNAGAEYGAVIFTHDGGWTIEACGTTEEVQVASIPLEQETEMVPAAIIGYAARTREEVVLHHASAEGMFARSRYVRDKGLKSVLCLPILSQGRLVCLLYMENNLMAGLFTPQRLDMLRVLGAQAAISIANAKLFAHIQELKDNLEGQVQARTRSLEQYMHDTSAALAQASVAEERNRIAQEIHDIVGHTLTSTILQIEAGKRLLLKDVEGGLRRLNEAQELVRHSLNEIRGSVHMLKQDKYSDLTVLLEQLIRGTEQNAGVIIETEIQPLPDFLPVKYKKAIYHALQEGLTNGIRHGKSQRFMFALRMDNNYLHFSLKDYGRGSGSLEPGFGLTTMKERMEQMGGSLQMTSRPGQGCLLQIVLPLPVRWMGD